jgi:hypothetical protein
MTNKRSDNFNFNTLQNLGSPKEAVNNIGWKFPFGPGIEVEVLFQPRREMRIIGNYFTLPGSGHLLVWPVMPAGYWRSGRSPIQ